MTTKTAKTKKAAETPAERLARIEAEAAEVREEVRKEEEAKREAERKKKIHDARIFLAYLPDAINAALEKGKSVRQKKAAALAERDQVAYVAAEYEAYCAVAAANGLLTQGERHRRVLELAHEPVISDGMRDTMRVKPHTLNRGFDPSKIITEYINELYNDPEKRRKDIDSIEDAAIEAAITPHMNDTGAAS